MFQKYDTIHNNGKITDDHLIADSFNNFLLMLMLIMN